MTREQFLEFHNGYYGEEVDNLKQIVSTTFSGEELYEYALALLKFKSKLQEVVSAVEKDKMEDNEFVQFAEYFRHNFDYYDDTESGSVYKWREFGKRKESPMLAKDILKHWKLNK